MSFSLIVQTEGLLSNHRKIIYFNVTLIIFFLSLADLMPRVKVQSVETIEGCTHEVSTKSISEVGVINGSLFWTV